MEVAIEVKYAIVWLGSDRAQGPMVLRGLGRSDLDRRPGDAAGVQIVKLCGT